MNIEKSYVISKNNKDLMKRNKHCVKYLKTVLILTLKESKNVKLMKYLLN